MDVFRESMEHLKRYKEAECTPRLVSASMFFAAEGSFLRSDPKHRPSNDGHNYSGCSNESGKVELGVDQHGSTDGDRRWDRNLDAFSWNSARSRPVEGTGNEQEDNAPSRHPSSRSVSPPISLEMLQVDSMPLVYSVCAVVWTKLVR